MSPSLASDVQCHLCLPVVVGVKERLGELEVILETALDQTIHWNNFVSVHHLARRLQNFEGLDVERYFHSTSLRLVLNLTFFRVTEPGKSMSMSYLYALPLYISSIKKNIIFGVPHLATFIFNFSLM
jgi:hypothetical protein